MELNGFLEKFVPDNCKVAIRNRNRSITHSSEELIPMFDIALQNFADTICEKQRKNCVKEARVECISWDKYVVDKEYILDAEQPKIEEL
jgi:hypothetical protein